MLVEDEGKTHYTITDHTVYCNACMKIHHIGEKPIVATPKTVSIRTDKLLVEKDIEKDIENVDEEN
ncbi:MAG: hypothetical protein HQK96_06960 [Nitrospirae bacterium]|nr:hypothetical protein [Nitrospirota bacterium]